MKIPVSDPGFMFSAFYVLSFTVTFAVVVAWSVRNRQPLGSVLLMLTTVSFLTVAGSRLVTVPVSDWYKIIITGSSEAVNNRSAIGALIFGLAGLLISYRILGTRMDILKLYAWLAPLGFGIQKIGCFLNGCCFGKATSMPWGVQYATGTNAHFLHWQTGLIGTNDTFSLAVHPVQLYESLGLIIISLVVWKTRNMWKRHVSMLIFALMLFAFFRFATEFLRQPSSVSFGSEYLAGVRVLQWGLLITGVVLGSSLFVSERLLKTMPAVKQSHTIPPTAIILYLVFISAAIFLFRGVFTGYELLSIDIRLFAVIAIIGVQSIRNTMPVRLRLAATAFLLVPAALVAFSFPQQSDIIAEGKSRSSSDTIISTYRQFDIGGFTGNYLSDLAYNPQQGSCGTYYTHENYRHEFRMAGVGYSEVLISGNQKTAVGLNAFAGLNKEYNFTTDTQNESWIAGVTPYLKHDWKWVGMGAGLMVGNLRWIPLEPLDIYYYDSGTKSFFILPEFSFRVGRRDIIDMRYEYGMGFPVSLPAISHEFSIGSGFGSPDVFSARIGLSPGTYGSLNKHLMLEGQLTRQVGLSLRYNFGRGEFYDAQNSDYYNWFGIRLSYRFGFNKPSNIYIQ